MSPPAATASARRRSPRGPAGGRRRAAARRRRRWTGLGLALVALAVIAFVLLMPLAQRAVNDLRLPLRYAPIIRRQAHEKHLDPALIAAVIYAETKFIPRMSSAGAEGPMQIQPATALDLARRSGATTFRVSDLWTPAVNIAYGSYYLRELVNEYHGNTMLALAAYNGGETNVNRWLAEARSRDHPLRMSEIPFPETRAYVQRVLKARSEYRRKYAGQLGYK